LAAVLRAIEADTSQGMIDVLMSYTVIKLSEVVANPAGLQNRA
jgi:hypothetical protein